MNLITALDLTNLQLDVGNDLWVTSVEIDLDYSVAPSDMGADNPDDYYGYSEISSLVIFSYTLQDEDGNETVGEDVDVILAVKSRVFDYVEDLLIAGEL